MIYADYNGSAPVSKATTDYLMNRLQEGVYSNPNATHELGKKMLFKMERSRRVLAKSLGCRPSQVMFNSGSSEGISHIFHSILEQAGDKNIIITSKIEHMAIVQACEFYADKGFTTYQIETLQNGQIDMEHFQSLLNEHKGKIALVTVIAANNETGVIQPYKELGKLCHEAGTLFFSDTTQYIGKTEFNFAESNMDFAVSSSHKIGALIGSGIVLSKNPCLLKKFIFGGGQENGLRGGTQNYIAIETMGVAINDFQANLENLSKVKKMRENFETNMKKKFPNVHIVGEKAPRLASTTMIAYPGLSGQLVQGMLETQEIYVTTSSACSDKKAGNRILEAMNLPDEICSAVIRVSLCTDADQALYDQIEDTLTRTYNKLIDMYKL